MDCANVAWEKVRGGVVYVGGFKAHCTGACVFSAEGARRFLDFAARNTPTIIDSVTRLYASTERGLSHAVYVRPRIFKQDRRLFPDGVTGDAHAQTRPMRPTRVMAQTRPIGRSFY